MCSFLSVALCLVILAQTIHCCTDSLDNECDFCLSTSDFEAGTYRIMNSGLYCLTSDIVFNPNPGNLSHPNDDSAWFPNNDDQFPGCIAMSDGAFALGFFTVISIEADDVIFDLNGHRIEYSLPFYLQQRFGSIIEIANQPFLPNVGPTDFGGDFRAIDNITITNGELGLTSHHGIHSNNASHVQLSNLKIFDFEVAGIQLNGFQNAVLSDLDIGPSLHDVLVTGYYSNARFVVLALQRLLQHLSAHNLSEPRVSFSYLPRTESLSLTQIYHNLVESMNVVFRALSGGGQLSDSEQQNSVYVQAMRLFNNTRRVPDGSALYGIVLNSFSVAVDGFGDAQNVNDMQGQTVHLSGVHVHDLELAVNEVPAVYVDDCDSDVRDARVLKGPFGDVIDVRKMVSAELEDELTAAWLQDISYIGNPLIDAQLALFLHGDEGGFAFNSYLSEHFVNWAVHANTSSTSVSSSSSSSSCVRFVCNGDIMHHTNKGVVGIRLDGIEETRMSRVNISQLYNKSPLSVATFCSNFTAAASGVEDGALDGGVVIEGAMNTDLRALSVSDGDVLIEGDENVISHLYSAFGDVIGIHLMHGAMLAFADNAEVVMRDLFAATEVNLSELKNRTTLSETFMRCTMRIDDEDTVVVNAPSDELRQTYCVDLQDTNMNLGDDSNRRSADGVLGSGLAMDIAALILVVIFMVSVCTLVYVVPCKQKKTVIQVHSARDIFHEIASEQIAQSSPSRDPTETYDLL